jgi:hypothetical protein
MLAEILYTTCIFSSFCAVDRLLTQFTNLEGIYYLLHTLHNGVIVYSTYNEVYKCLTDYHYIINSGKNIFALQCVFALHFYHIVIYWRKFRFDDWLHHILMIGIALPIGAYTDSKALLGYSLFFMTGLPGGIDYLLLFFTRNGWLDKKYEKEINTWLNVWIRSPGCISHATLTSILISSQRVIYSIDWISGFLVACLTYWNGQYFMRQVVENNAIMQIKY